MQYFVFVAWRYMKKNPGRTIYSILGVMVTFILSFAIFTAGYSVWDYSYQIEGVFEAQLYVEEAWTNDEDEVIGITQEQIEQVKKLEQCDAVKKLYIKQFENWDDTEAKEISVNELQAGEECSIEIGLKDVSDLYQSAESLQDQTGLQLAVMHPAAEYFGQSEEDTDWGSAYHAIVAIIAAIFSFFCVMILRNTMMISAVERMQDYGLWRCVGMSRKQLYQQLAVEGFIISLFAAAGGIVGGFGLLKVIELWLNDILSSDVPFVFHLYPKAVLYTTLLCVGVTLYSLLEPARQVGGISPIEAIHNNIVLQGRKGKLRERIQYRQSKLWTKLFGVSGEYAYKNMHRNRGRSLSLFFSLMFCVILIGLTQSGVGSLYASVKNAYKGKDTEYLEVIYPVYDITSSEHPNYDEKLVSQIEEEVSQIESVQKVKRLIEKDEVAFYDPVMKKYAKEEKVNICQHYAYDEEQIEQFSKYLLEGEIDYVAMTEQNGILLCDMQYNVSSLETDFNQMDIRKTEYQVGDKIVTLSGEGEKRAKQLYEKALHQVAEKAGLYATWEDMREERTAEEIASSDEEYSSLDMMEKGEEGYEKYQKQMLAILAKEGVSIRAEDITVLCTDPETGESTGTESIMTIYNVLAQREYDRGAKETYVIQGIVSEDPINGGITTVNVYNPLTLIHAQDGVLPNINEEGWQWSIGVKRAPLDIMNGEIEKYCREQTTGTKLSGGYVFEGTEYDISEYLDMLATLNIVRVIIILITSGIIIICLIQIFNTLCANIVLRRKEFWLYGVVGMSRRQKYQMILLEHGVAAAAAIILGYFAAWGFSWYLIDYLLNQNGAVHYEWPWFIMLLVCGGILFLVEGISVLGIRSTAEK